MDLGLASLQWLKFNFTNSTTHYNIILRHFNLLLFLLLVSFSNRYGKTFSETIRNVEAHVIPKK